MKSGDKKGSLQQNAKTKKTDIKEDNIEDASKYGEFISSYFAWIPLSKQKEIAEHLEEITKQNK